MQRQTFSSRSSIASPLVLSENGTKPSWTHSAKLQLRSNSPSRFSLESHSSSPTLEMIGEVADTKLSACAYGSSPKSERLSGVRSALAALEGNPGARRLIEHVHSKAAVGQPEQRGSAQLGDNNNVAAGAEQVSPRHGAVAAGKDQKQRNGVADSPSVKRTAAKTGLQNERSPKKRAATSSTSSSSLSPASPAVDKLPSRAQAKSAAALVPSSKDKSDGAARAGKAASSRTATPSKKGSSQTAEASHQKRSSSPGLQSSHPQRKTSPRGGAGAGGGEKSSASGRTRAADRSAGRESSQTAGVTERKANPGGPASRSGPTGRAEGRPVRGADSKAVGRSSSSSSSMTSLRSGAPPAGGGPPSRAAQRSSKTEEKGLSFFKTALRPKDARKSSDGGKAEAKGASEDACGDKEGSQQAAKKAQNAPSEGKTNGTAAKDKESAKASSAAKHSLLPSAKSKLSAAELTNQPSGNAKEPSKKEPAKKTMQSRKIPINPAQTSHKAK